MIIKDACEMFKGVHCSVIPKTKKQKNKNLPKYLTIDLLNNVWQIHTMEELKPLTTHYKKYLTAWGNSYDVS